MINEVRAKTFKSGNSVALRLPKALGIKEGVEMTLKQLTTPARHWHRDFDLSFLKGRSLGLKPLRPEDRELEERELDWEGKLLKRD